MAAIGIEITLAAARTTLAALPRTFIEAPFDIGSSSGAGKRGAVKTLFDYLAFFLGGPAVAQAGGSFSVQVRGEGEAGRGG
jgi:hypothetical protein